MAVEENPNTLQVRDMGSMETLRLFVDVGSREAAVVAVSTRLLC